MKRDPKRRARDQRAALELLRGADDGMATSELARRAGWPDYRASRVLHSLGERVTRERIVDDDDPATTWTVWRIRA